jgi:hypothetical protein
MILDIAPSAQVLPAADATGAIDPVANRAVELLDQPDPGAVHVRVVVSVSTEQNRGLSSRCVNQMPRVRSCRIGQSVAIYAAESTVPRNLAGTGAPIASRRCLTFVIALPGAITMRYVLRFIFVLIVITLAWNWLQRPSARQAPERLITLLVQWPAPSPAVAVTVSEGYAVQVQRSIRDRFALRPVLVDDRDGPVRVTIESPEDGQVLDEFTLTRGEPVRETRTSPRFGVQVIQIDER